MLFNAYDFIFFLPIVVMLYYVIPVRFRWILLLLASYFFYMAWRVEYVFLILLSTIIDYLAGWQIFRSKSKARKQGFLMVSLLTNIGLLLFFKYYNFTVENINIIFKALSVSKPIKELDILLPVGISFYTFQTLSYTLDIYKGKIIPEKHFGVFAVFVSFFPQLVAGPIERAGRLLPQFHKKIELNYKDFRDGVIFMLWGFFMKIVIADRISEYVNEVYRIPQVYSGEHLLTATYFFSFQIYCDFAGYSLIAIGAARLLGIHLMNNFKRPYFALNIREFWSRWHISLSTWFRDYLYIPLGGNRVRIKRWVVNILLVFIISGFWHGANWTFIAWGAMHGLMMVVYVLWQARQKSKPGRLKRLLSVFFTFQLVSFSWVFFRADSLENAFFIIKQCFIWDGNLPLNLFANRNDAIIAVLAILLLLFVDILAEKYDYQCWISRTPRLIKYAALLLIFSAVVLLSKWNEADFLYFQF